MKMRSLMMIGLPMLAFAPADEGAGGGSGGDGQTPESVLFPNEGQGEGEGTTPPAGDGGEGEGQGGDGAGEWKEYEADPAKTDEENAAAKAEHDAKKTTDDKGGEADKVPADGKYQLEMPEGVEVDAELLEALGPEFAEMGLTTAQVQKLAGKFVELQTARGEGQMKAWSERVAGWAETARKDPDIGGDKWDATVKAARRATDTLGTPELREYLNASGGGNHPELIRLMAKVGAMISEDDPATGGAGGSGKPADPAHLLFPSDAPKG